MKILVCGSRGMNDGTTTLKLAQRLTKLEPTEIISGGAQGPDMIAEQWAKRNGVPVLVITPQWNIHGRSAGIKRNDAMLDRNPDLVIACWDGQSKGTKYTIDQARKRGVATEVRYASGRVERFPNAEPEGSTYSGD